MSRLCTLCSLLPAAHHAHISRCWDQSKTDLQIVPIIDFKDLIIFSMDVCLSHGKLCMAQTGRESARKMCQRHTWALVLSAASRAIQW